MTSEAVLFALVREGTSDDGLIPHLRELLVRAGLNEVVGGVRTYHGSVAERLSQIVNEEAGVDLVFIHRDSDSPSASARHDEIRTAAESLGDSTPVVVGVVPIQELEAWLLLDELAIRTVVGRPSGRSDLHLPKLSKIERTSSPKEVLQQALLTASETTGRRLKEEKARFSQRRRTLLERLDIDGPIHGLAAWRRLEADIAAAVAELEQRKKA